MPKGVYTRKIEPATDRFWRLSGMGKANLCWLWRGSKLTTGYGCLKDSNKKTIRAHRFSWFLVNGAVPRGMDICHSCDVRLCVNPSHLFVGTRKDNMEDCSRKNRNTSGSKSNFAKISEKDVIEIIKSSQPQVLLAAKYGVSQSNVSRIKSGNTWRRSHASW
ncbi:HNH nuclease [uncultured Caudovirales phage]|uniref:HNH nuclease n=1 Tax=uncultured Caudovirales phage TaxID=2100421 RepID=A0A6J5SV31_9CAUD|nr:HNH nuclease [uncultured Caudovirales phage]